MDNELNSIRYKSVFRELPLIGEIPRYIRGNILTTKFGDLNLEEQSSNFFRKLNWYEDREFEIEEVECTSDSHVGFYKVKKGKRYKVNRIQFYYSCASDRFIHEIIICHEKDLGGNSDPAYIYYEAKNFIPTKYKILKDNSI